MYTRLYSFLVNNEILYKYQFGFRKNHSTNLALLEIIDNIREFLDGKECVIGVYLDLTKAFNTVQHDILLMKLEHYGVRGIANKWFKSYLTNRRQYVHVNGEDSDMLDINTGVPQGSVLGPLLFLVYINDIANAITSPQSLVMLFADDTNVFLKGKDLISLKRQTEHTLHQLSEWFATNKLTLSLEKTQYNIFHNKNKFIPAECNTMNIQNNNVVRVNEAKYLGVVLDEALSWKGHIDQLSKSLQKYASSFKIIKNHIPPHCKKQLFFAHVNSRIQYGIEVYGNAPNKYLKRVQVLQNKILKTLFNKPWDMSTIDLHHELELLKVCDVFKMRISQFVFKSRKKLLPNIFNDYYHLVNEVHDYETRDASELYVKRSRTATGAKSAKIRGAQIFNDIPSEVKNCSTPSSFNAAMKKHFIQSYSP